MKKYFAIFKLGMVNTIKNHKALLGISIFLVTCLIIFLQLWKIVPENYTGIFTREKLLWYIAFNEWVFIAIPEVQLNIENDFRTGRLSYQLSKPVSYIGAVFAENLGVFFINFIVLGIVILLFISIKFHHFPFSILVFSTSVLLSFFAGLLGIIFQMIIGLCSFWISEISPIYWIWEKFLFMCGGLILPLSLCPQLVQKVASFTPFPIILGQRSLLAVNFNVADFTGLLFSLILWWSVGIILLKIIFHYGLRILNIGGG